MSDVDDVSGVREQCKQLEGAVIAVADGSASAEEVRAVREHVATCAACAKELAETRALLGAVRAAETSQPEQPQAFWDALEKSVLVRVEAEAAAVGGRQSRERERASDELAAARARKVEEGRPMGRVAIYVSLVAAAAIAVFYGLRLRGGGSGSDAPVVAGGVDAGAPHEMIDPGELALDEAAGPDELDLLSDEALGRLDGELEAAEDEAFGRLDVDLDDDSGDDGEPALEELSDEDLQRVYEALEPAPQNVDPGKSG